MSQPGMSGSPHVKVTRLKAAAAPRRAGCTEHCRMVTLFRAGRRWVERDVALHDPDAHEAFGRVIATVMPERSGMVVAGPLVVDLRAWRVTVDGAEPHLTPVSHRLLICLAGRAGVACTHAEVVRAVWGPEYLEVEQSDWEHLARVSVSRLRTALGPEAAAAIATVPGLGYRLDAEITDTNGAGHAT